MKNNALGDRMKGYEQDGKLLNRIPVIIRIDGKAFHTFCKRFERPYDSILNDKLNKVMKVLCSEIQGAKFGERHSDEISILVTDYDRINTDAYFDYNIQKISSVTASIATAEFCKQLTLNACFPYDKEYLNWEESWPNFDSRCFNIPENEISNYFWWRHLDATRNSIGMLARSKFSHKELHNKNTDQMQEMLFSKFGINWNDFPQEMKSGFICTREMHKLNNEKGEFTRKKWVIKPSPRTIDELRSEIESSLQKDV